MSDTENKTAEAKETEAKATETEAKAAPAPKTRARKAPDAAPAEEAAPEPKLFLTLERGANYALNHGGILYRFKRGVEHPKPVPASLVEYVMENALDFLTMTDGDGNSTSEPRPKFKVREEA